MNQKLEKNASGLRKKLTTGISDRLARIRAMMDGICSYNLIKKSSVLIHVLLETTKMFQREDEKFLENYENKGSIF